MNSTNGMNLKQYQKIISQDPSKTADIHRKCLAHIVQASYISQPNVSSCSLLEFELQRYSDMVYKNNENMYNKRLKQTLMKVKSNIPRTFKTNLEFVDTNKFVEPLDCSSQIHCSNSELMNETEFYEFCEAFYEQRTPKFSISRNERILKIQDTETPAEIKHNSSPGISRSVDEVKYPCSFKTAKDELNIQNMKKYGNSNHPQSLTLNNGGQKRKLGFRRNINSKFISPLMSNSGSQDELSTDAYPTEVDERLKNLDPKMVELIKAEIMDCGPNIHWNDIAGLSFAKNAIQEAVVWPMLRPDIFTGLRRPPKGILLFGPPGTGKTLIGKCVASQSKSTFFSISASSLTSKWVGDGEKMVRALFMVARVHQPSVIFIDEIDSLLSQRSDTEHESSRRIKTEFLVQLDGATTDNEERILVIGATNRPQELDEAARRRFVKRLYIPLPDYEARLQLVKKLMLGERHQIQEQHFCDIATLSDGYSGADIRNLCSEASLGPIRSIDINAFEHIQATEVRPLVIDDFTKAFNRVRSSVSSKDLEHYIGWDKTYGSGF